MQATGEKTRCWREGDSNRWSSRRGRAGPPPSRFDRHVLSFDIAGFAQSLAERDHIRCSRAGRGEAEAADHRHRLLLRAGGEWPRERRATEKSDEFAPPHARPLDPMASNMAQP